MTEMFVPLAADIAVILVLAYAIYYPRHRRRDLPVAYVALNLGVFAVVALLAEQRIELAVGFGLFGILSIIRLRSDAIAQTEVAYYFTSLVLGLVNGIHPGLAATAVLNGVLLVAMFAVDHPKLLSHTRRRTVMLDVAYPSEESARPDLERKLGGRVLRASIRKVDYVQDTTTVDVCYRA